MTTEATEVTEVPTTMEEAGAELDALTGGEETPPAVNEPVAEPEGEAEPEAEAESETEEEAPKEGRVPIERLNKEVARRKTAETEATALKEKVADLEARLNGEALAVAAKAGIPPEYVSTEDRTTVAEEQRWREVLEFCRSNPDGFEGIGKERSYSSAEIRKWQDLAQDALLEVAPEARRIRREALRLAEADRAAGRKARLDRAAREAATTAAARKSKDGKGGAAGGPAVRPSPTPPALMAGTRGMSEERFEKRGGTRDAAAKELAELVPPD